MPIFRKDAGGLYKLFVEQKFQKPNVPGKEYCRYFDGQGENGVAEIEQCLKRTEPANEEEYLQERRRHMI